MMAGAMFAVVACGPSAEEKAAQEQARLDSIAAAQAEQARLDSIAAAEAAAAMEAADTTAPVEGK